MLMNYDEDMLKINWDLREFWKRDGAKPPKNWCFYCVYTDNMTITKKTFRNS